MKTWVPPNMDKMYTLYTCCCASWLDIIRQLLVVVAVVVAAWSRLCLLTHVLPQAIVKHKQPSGAWNKGLWHWWSNASTSKNNRLSTARLSMTPMARIRLLEFSRSGWMRVSTSTFQQTLATLVIFEHFWASKMPPPYRKIQENASLQIANTSEVVRRDLEK